MVTSFLDREPEAKELVDLVRTVEEVGKAKPDPEVYLSCARHFGVRPEECIIFEDELQNLASAQKNGIPCVCFLSSKRRETEKRAASDLLIENYADLL